MRRLLTLLILLPACREPAHITVKLDMLCGQEPMGLPQPQQCNDMQLECANFIEVRLYDAPGGQLGNILGSKCIPLDSFSPRPRTLCDLQALQGTLIDSLPEGKTVRFRMRALLVRYAQNGCNDDIPGQPTPELVFDGFSPPVAIDGASHQATIRIGTCGSCRYQAPACNTTRPDCPAFPGCGPGQTAVGFDPVDCCAITCIDCDARVDPSCGIPTVNCDAAGNPPVMCPVIGMTCSDGQPPTRVPGDCCLRCRDPNMPPTVMSDGGVTPL